MIAGLLLNGMAIASTTFLAYHFGKWWIILLTPLISFHVKESEKRSERSDEDG